LCIDGTGKLGVLGKAFFLKAAEVDNPGTATVRPESFSARKETHNSNGL
jgi:hypothetical protein